MNEQQKVRRIVKTPQGEYVGAWCEQKQKGAMNHLEPSESRHPEDVFLFMIYKDGELELTKVLPITLTMFDNSRITIMPYIVEKSIIITEYETPKPKFTNQIN